MYDRVASNVRKSWALIFVFVLVVLAVGGVAGYLLDAGPAPLLIAFVVAVVMAWSSYFASDAIALSMSRAKPADENQFRQLHNVVEGLSLAAGMPKPRVYVVDDPAPNAFATGRNPQRAAVAVTTGLAEKMNRDELEGVLAHELSHIKNRDTLVMALSVTLIGVIVLLADFTFRMTWWSGSMRSRGRRGSQGAGGVAAVVVIIGVALLILAPFIARLLHFAISRRREFLADADAVLLTRHPEGLIAALEKLKSDQTVVRSATRATAHLWIESPIQQEAHGRGDAPKVWLNHLFNTHPPLDDRIQALRTSSLSGPAGPRIE